MINRYKEYRSWLTGSILILGTIMGAVISYFISLLVCVMLGIPYASVTYILQSIAGGVGMITAILIILLGIEKF